MSLPTDLIAIVVIIFVFAMSVFIGHTILSEYDEFLEGRDDMPPLAYNITDRALQAFANLDFMFIFVVGGLMIAAIIGAFLIPTHPIFLVLAVVVFILVLIIVPQIANVFLEFSESTTLNASTVVTFPTMVSIWNIMPLIVLVFGALFIIVTYAKIRSPREAA